MDFERIQRIFDSAALKRSERRDAYVLEQCGEEPEILQEVLALLASHDAAPADFLTTTCDFRLPDDFDPDDL